MIPISQLMTPEAYVQHAGGCCPACRSGQIAGNSFDSEAAQVWQHLRCLACGASWTDIYHLQGYEDLDLADQLPQEEQTRLLREVLRDRDLNPHDVLDLADGVEAALLALPAIQENIRAAWREEYALAAKEADEREEDERERAYHDPALCPVRRLRRHLSPAFPAHRVRRVRRHGARLRALGSYGR